MKIMIAANAPWMKTGYGEQGASLARRLRDAGHNVTYYCNYGLNSGIIDWEGIMCLPSNGQGYTDPIIKGHIRYADPDVILTLFDLWPLHNTDIPTFIQTSGAAWVAWFPIDAIPISRTNLEVLKYISYPVAMANFVQEELKKSFDYEVQVIPHGVEKHFGYTAAGRREWRRYFQIPEDAFVFGSVGRNAYFPGRKGFDRLMRAFAEADIPNSYLYIHALTNSEMGSVPLPQIAEFYGITDRVKFPDEYNAVMGVSKAGMSAMYSAFDAYVQPTLGEGFGIPVLEAQACGAVTIATDCTSMPELLCPDASQLVPGITELFVPDPSHRVLIDIEKLKDSMREIYEIKHTDVAGFQSMKARAGLWANGWDWDRIWRENWVPLLTEIERERTMSPRTERHRGNGLVFEHNGLMRKQDSSIRSPAVKKERDLLLTLDHPNIVPITAYGENEDGTAWFDMPKLIPLQDLDVSVLSEEAKQRILSGVDAGLNYLHERGLSHRDVCPANVLVDSSMNPYLIDFEWAHPCEGKPCVDFEPWLCMDKAVAIHQLGMEQRGYHTIMQFIRGIDLSQKTHGFKGVPYQNVDGVGERDCQPRWDRMKPDVLGKSVVDLGSNLGWFVRKALEEGAEEAHGFENDVAVVESAKALGGTFFQMDLNENLPLRKYDVGLCLSVLQHLENPDRVFKWLIEACDTVFIEIPVRFVTEYMAQFLKDADYLGESERGRPMYRIKARVLA